MGTHPAGSGKVSMDTENRPVLTGLIALVGVAVVIGLLGGLAVMVGVKASGIGEDSSAGSGGGAPATFNLPRPTDTGTPTPTPTDTGSPSETGTEPPAPTTGITLSTPQQSVGAMQQIVLTGSYQAGEGAILQVQRLEDGTWADFPVTMSVGGGTFSTYVLTGRTGENTFRVIDTDTEVTSNEVTVTVG